LFASSTALLSSVVLSSNTTEKNDEGSLDLEKEKDTYKDEKDNGKKKNELEFQ
jgi:hypothetical protein